MAEAGRSMPEARWTAGPPPVEPSPAAAPPDGGHTLAACQVGFARKTSPRSASDRPSPTWWASTSSCAGRRRLAQGPVPVPRREHAVLQRHAGQGAVPLLLLRRGRRRHQVRPADRAPRLHRGGRAAGRPGGRGAPLRAGRLRPRPGAQPAPPADRGAPRGRGLLSPNGSRGDPATARPRAFLAERGFELADAERFGVGYSPNAWDELIRHLRGRAASPTRSCSRPGLARQGSGAA